MQYSNCLLPTEILHGKMEMKRFTVFAGSFFVGYFAEEFSKDFASNTFAAHFLKIFFFPFYELQKITP
jgi:hypothetical protein